MKRIYKNLTKKRLFLIFAFCAMLFSTSNVYAFNPEEGYICEHGYHTLGDRQMGYGVGNYGKNRRYYYASGFDSTYMGYIADAVDEWVHTSNEGPHVKTSISIRQTTNKKSALFEFVPEWLGGTGLGVTRHYLYQDQIFPVNGALPKNYGWAKSSLNVDILKTIPEVDRKGTIAHELGHAMGLSHQNYRPASIMCQYGNGRSATRADALDCETINHIYG